MRSRMLMRRKKSRSRNRSHDRKKRSCMLNRLNSQSRRLKSVSPAITTHHRAAQIKHTILYRLREGKQRSQTAHLECEDDITFLDGGHYNIQSLAGCIVIFTVLFMQKVVLSSQSSLTSAKPASLQKKEPEAGKLCQNESIINMIPITDLDLRWLHMRWCRACYLNVGTLYLAVRVPVEGSAFSQLVYLFVVRQNQMK